MAPNRTALAAVLGLAGAGLVLGSAMLPWTEIVGEVPFRVEVRPGWAPLVAGLSLVAAWGLLASRNRTAFVRWARIVLGSLGGLLIAPLALDAVTLKREAVAAASALYRDTLKISSSTTGRTVDEHLRWLMDHGFARSEPRAGALLACAGIGLVACGLALRFAVPPRWVGVSAGSREPTERPTRARMGLGPTGTGPA